MLDTAGLGVRYRQPPLLFRNEGGRYRNVSAEAGPAFRKELPPAASRSATSTTTAAWTCCVANNGMAPVLLHNEAAAGTTGWA